jgi:lysophospholipase L1-like esterase
MGKLLSLLAVTICFSVAAHAAALEAQPVDAPWWWSRHETFLRQTKTDKIDILFLGDSITEQWLAQGRKVWDEQLAPLGAADFGIGGDRIQNVLWRVRNGELDGIAPKVVVLLIGTNNVPDDSIDDISSTHDALIAEIQARLPQAKLLLLGIFPRFDDWTVDAQPHIAPINRLLARHADGSRTFFLDFGARLCAPDGGVDRSIMFDTLHLSELGYRIWAEAMMPTLRELLSP